MMRCLRPDRMTYAVLTFVEEKLGNKYVDNKAVEFAKSFEESGPSTPIFFILSPGVNPLKDVEVKYNEIGGNLEASKFEIGNFEKFIGHWHIVNQFRTLPSFRRSAKSWDSRNR